MVLHRIEIFRAGRHTSNEGTTIDFTQADLAASVKAYDPKKHEAPVVLGHPADNAPAFGWAKSLDLKGSVVGAHLGQLEASFVEDVRAGRRNKVSASFYTPTSPHNPVPGVYYLRHIGFLGAAPPSVKGLAPVAFGEGETTADFVEVPFGTASFAEGGRTAIELLESARAVIESQLGADAAEAAIPAAEVEALKKKAEEAAKAAPDAKATPDAKAKEAAAAKPAPPAEFSERELALAKREKEIADREAAARRKEHVTFCEGLHREGRIVPLSRPETLGLLEAVDTIKPGAVSFGEGDKRTPLDVLQQLLARTPKSVDFTELSGGAGPDDDEDPSALAARATAYQAEQAKAGNHISTSAAVRHVKGAH